MMPDHNAVDDRHNKLGFGPDNEDTPFRRCRKYLVQGLFQATLGIVIILLRLGRLDDLLPPEPSRTKQPTRSTWLPITTPTFPDLPALPPPPEAPPSPGPWATTTRP
nr:hypothetical protein GCM10017745_48120 [Saccharothrix mutabilis subsp. capreolus]